jgi:hypothetical protein
MQKQTFFNTHPWKRPLLMGLTVTENSVTRLNCTLRDAAKTLGCSVNTLVVEMEALGLVAQQDRSFVWTDHKNTVLAGMVVQVEGVCYLKEKQTWAAHVLGCLESTLIHKMKKKVLLVIWPISAASKPPPA